MVDRIRSLCKENGTSIKQLEKELGFGNGIIARWSKSKPNYDRLLKVAERFNVSVEYLLGDEEQKKEPTTVSGSELDEKSLIRAKKLSEATPDIQSLVDAILNDESYRPKVVDKIVEVVCPLSGRVERIEQRYFIHGGKRIPDRNNGCEQYRVCEECGKCQLRVMESVR